MRTLGEGSHRAKRCGRWQRRYFRRQQAVGAGVEGVDWLPLPSLTPVDKHQISFFCKISTLENHEGFRAPREE